MSSNVVALNLEKSNSFRPLVSIIIPVFNGKNFLREAINSALEQTYENCEVIVVNDGSSDGGATKAICESFQDRIRYVEKPNGGCGSALNTGISICSGEYVSWLSHDDKYHPQKIESQIRFLQQLEKANHVVYSGYELIDRHSSLLGVVRPDQKIPADQLNDSLLPLLRGLIHGCSLLIPTEAFSVVRQFDESLRCTQDYDLWFDLFQAYGLRFQSEIHTSSRIHPDQDTNRVSSVLDECNRLWSGFLNRLSEDQMTSMAGSPAEFLAGTYEFLCSSPYDEARNLSERLLVAKIQSTLVTVIIPFHNRVDWTIAAIGSVRAQTHENLEILAVDDGSNEDISRLRDYCRQDRRIRLIKSRKQGVASARNIGIDQAKGLFIAFLDSDDLFESNKIELQLDYMVRNSISFSHTSYRKIDINGSDLGVVNTSHFAGDQFPQIIKHCPIATPTVMVSRRFLGNNRFPEQLHVGEDVCLWMVLAEECDIGSVDQPLTKVRIRSDSAAYDLNKQRIGFVGMAFFALSTKSIANHHGEIRTLLKLGLALLDDHDESLTTVSQKRKQVLGGSIPKMVKIALALGPKRTLQEVLKRTKQIYSQRRRS